MSFTKKSDASGLGSIISGTGWATHIHESNDPINPWFSVKIESTGERIKGYGNFNDYVDSLLPDIMKKK